mmetsp:Transcript_60605/g.156156  ORF Transcript_60605/g.156156 Transcript_60605/m.156156 type:complete len:359 (+) Transcript_60605:3-1079(+)
MVYYLRLSNTAFCKVEPVEWLSCLVAAIAHDVGHTGTSNRFHTNAGTTLARLFSDQSVLENMHCTLTFAVLRVSHCDIIAHLAPELQKQFRSLVVKMILETDLGKHVMLLSRFRQEFLHLDAAANKAELEPAQLEQLLAFLLKACDVAHSAKPFDLHAQWTMRINAEFFLQGDIELEFGLPVSPFCDRDNTDVAESQLGFFKFIVSPLYEALDEFLCSPKMRFEVLPGILRNREYWSQFSQTFLGEFDTNDPMSNIEQLQRHFRVQELKSLTAARRVFASSIADLDPQLGRVSEEGDDGMSSRASIRRRCASEEMTEAGVDDQGMLQEPSMRRGSMVIRLPSEIRPDDSLTIGHTMSS